MLVYVHTNTVDSETVHWRNLTTERSGTATSPGNLVVAAPDGWVEDRHQTTMPNAGVLYLHTTTGATRSLGSPYPGGAGFLLAASATTLVVYSGPDSDDDNGTAVAMRFAHRGVYHRLVTRHDDSSYTECPSVTNGFIACRTVHHRTVEARLYTPTGKQALVTAEGCPDSVAVDGDAMASETQRGASCPTNRLTVTRRNGDSTRPVGTYGTAGLVSAFGQVVATCIHNDRLALVTPTGRTPTIVSTA
jgi:hypothetical protein